MRFAEKFCYSAKKTDPSQLSLFGTTSEPSMDVRGMAQSMSYLAGSRVNRSRSPEISEEPTTSATYGLRCSASSEKSNRDGSSPKTFRGLLDATSKPFSGILPKAGSMQCGVVSALPMLEHHTSGSGFGYLPTPTANSYGSQNNGSPGDGRAEYATKGKPSLETMARAGAIPTPTAGDAKSSGSRNTAHSKAHPGTSLTDWMRADGGTGRNAGETSRRLNPEFVEWMMGWPIGHTDIGYTRSETDRFRSATPKRGDN